MRIARSVLMVMLLAQQTVVAAQTPSAPAPDETWGAVKALHAGDEVTIKLNDGRSVKGRLIYVRDAELALRDGKREAALERQNVYQVFRHVPKSRKKAVAIGAAVGGGAGVIAGASSDGAGDLSQPGATVLAGAVYAGAGALIGWAFGGGKKRELIYQARR